MQVLYTDINDNISLELPFNAKLKAEIKRNGDHFLVDYYECVDQFFSKVKFEPMNCKQTLCYFSESDDDSEIIQDFKIESEKTDNETLRIKHKEHLKNKKSFTERFN